MKQEKIGLVLEGGGMRAIYTAGVLDLFLEEGIHVDGAVGVSAGALRAASFISGQKGRDLRYSKRYCRDWRFMSFRSLLLTGDLVGEQFCYHDLPDRLDPFDYEAFDRADTAYYACCSNVETGQPEYLRIRDLHGQMEIMRASASMPYVSKIVKTGGKKLLDGGCTDSIPARAFLNMGYRRCIVVCTREEGYQKKPESIWMAGIFYRRYPAFVEALKRRHLVYNETLADLKQLEAEGRIFLMKPSRKPEISRTEHDPEKIQAVYDLGRQDTQARLARLKEWLAGGGSQ